ncbi:hypothetical protein XH98_00115 [Bradyrhizobium sp. CCBAU 51745]|uniref:hypothetical protein n=1 Tax=Bradyrhizobium sp. CCBAU 51745 TaxID=1325099 RepID=UPI002304DD05|nr:hypothetical protein [Bradyrhizobium sp. CCBAU 51745]MDA9437541.1 hypothetical protein [Bradyrhizobium sp. CCBAU 51745]
MHFLALIYFVVLSLILAAGVRPQKLGGLRTSLAIFVLIWSVFILTALALSLFSAMDSAGLYVAVSLLIAAATSLWLRSLRSTGQLSFPEFASPFDPLTTKIVAWFLAISSGIVLISVLVLAWELLPANPDSIVYRFSRVYWYISHGSMAHFSNQGEPRPQFYPFNGAIAYFPLVYFQFGPRAFSSVSLVCWLVIAATTYVFSRDLGGPRIVAAANAWVIWLTPNILVQSLSTNDDMIAATPLLVGLYFLYRWFQGRQAFDALVGVAGVAISAGTKLHITFYFPLVLAIALAFLVHYRATWKEVRTWLTIRGLSFVVLLCAIVLVFSASFIVYNVAASGQLFAWDYAAQIQNRPFHLPVALQSIVLFASQMVITPIADLHFPQWRASHYERFNDLFAPLFTWVNNGPDFTSAFYRFNGINPSGAIMFNEQTLFLGFTWVLIIVSALWLTRKWKDPRASWARFHIASFPVWFVTYAASSRYIEGVSVYLAYAMVVVGPALVYAFAPIQRASIARIRLILLAAIAVTQIFFAASILLTNPVKNLLLLARTPERPISKGFLVDPSVTDEIGRARDGLYQYVIGWGQPYWAFMAYHPEIKQFLASQPTPLTAPPGEADDAVSVALRYSRYALMPRADSKALHLYSFPQIPAYGRAIALRIPDKASPGLTLMGQMLFALGPEWVFGAGNGVEGRFAGRDKYIVMQFVEPSDFGRNAEQVVRISPVIYGLGVKDDLKFRFEIKNDGQVVSQSDWQAVPSVDLATTGIKPGSVLLTMYVRNDNAAGAIHATSVILQSTKPTVLPTVD